MCVLNLQTDIWSLGCCVYEMAYGKLKLTTSTAGGKPVKCCDFTQQWPWNEELKELAMSMLEIKPRSRPTVQEILNKLNNLASPKPLTAGFLSKTLPADFRPTLEVVPQPGIGGVKPKISSDYHSDTNSGSGSDDERKIVNVECKRKKLQ